MPGVLSSLVVGPGSILLQSSEEEEQGWRDGDREMGMFPQKSSGWGGKTVHTEDQSRRVGHFLLASYLFLPLPKMDSGRNGFCEVSGMVQPTECATFSSLLSLSFLKI